MAGGQVLEAGSGTPPADGLPEKLRIVHCFRSPIGGLFRHVRDLAEAQAAAGHEVGMIADSLSGGAYEDAIFARVAPGLALGLTRLPMRRQIAPSDAIAAARVMRQVKALHPDVLHGHGAKGGAYARIIGTLLRASGGRVARIYTPHGGSLHYDAGSMKGRAYFAAERLLAWMTDGFIFVSRYEADAFHTKVGTPRAPVTVLHNGIREEEFAPVVLRPDARDVLFIGMLRDLKGPDVLIEALAKLRRQTGGAPSAHIVGSGDDKPKYMAMVEALGLADRVSFHEPMPAREAFTLSRLVVVPSRAESMPYLVLEALAAGRPMVATKVGGIPEIFGDEVHALVAPGDPDALASAIETALAAPAKTAAQAWRLRQRVRSDFTVEAMAAAAAKAYAQAVPRRHPH